VSKQSGDELHDVRSGHHRFHSVDSLVNPSADGKRHSDAIREDGHRMEAQ
jgi:hypothetical protein